MRRRTHWHRICRQCCAGTYFQLEKLLGSPAQCILRVPEPVTYQTTSHKHTVSFLTDAHDEYVPKHNTNPRFYRIRALQFWPTFFSWKALAGRVHSGFGSHP